MLTSHQSRVEVTGPHTPGRCRWGATYVRLTIVVEDGRWMKAVGVSEETQPQPEIAHDALSRRGSEKKRKERSNKKSPLRGSNTGPRDYCQIAIARYTT